ncbi:MAG: cupin domain-containing protein [Sedimentisphaerales bacterium]
MSCVQVKGMVVTLVFVCLTGCIFVSGCSMGNNNEAEMTPGKALVIDLTDAPEYQPLLKGVPQTSGMHSGRVYLKPGEECGRHSTGSHEEMLVFLAGRGEAMIGKKGRPVGEGKICYIPPYTFHNIKNTGTEPLVYIYCVAPVSPAVADGADEHQHQH